MRIDFKRIEIHNFKSFGDETFDFEKHNGMNLICGKNLDIPNKKNGAGKTTLIGALVFSLFGQTQSNSRNCNIANKWLTDKEVRVATYFSIDTHNYKVVSGFNSRGGQYCEVSEIIGNDTVNLTKSTMSETREYLEREILHCDKSIFMRTVLLSSDQNYNFFMLRKAEKKEFIEKLFDITIFGDMYAKIHFDLNSLDKVLISKQNKLAILNKNNDDYSARFLEFENKKNKQILVLTENINDFKQHIQELKQSQITVNQSEVKKYEDMLEKVSEAYRLIADKQRQLNSLNQTDEVKKHQILSSIDNKQKAIDKYSEILGKLCKKCQPLFKDYYNISNFDVEISSLKKQVMDINAIVSNRSEQIKELDSKLDECNNKTTKINVKLHDLTSESAKVHAQLGKMEEKLSTAERDIAKAESATNPYLDLKAANELELHKESNELSTLEEKYKYLKFAESIVSQDTLRKFIISDLIGLLNNKIKTYLTKFGAKYEVIFDADMNYKLVDSVHEFDYGDFSGGERSQLMIAACFAFRDFMYVRNNFSSNILFLDEFIDGAIDSAAIESVISILTEYSKQYDQNVFIISHRKSEMDNTLFDNIIQVVKKDHISHIEYL